MTGSHSAGAHRQIVRMMEQALGYGGKAKVAFVYTVALSEPQTLRAMVEERPKCLEELMAALSPALGVHPGPSTVGVCYVPVCGRPRWTKVKADSL